MAIAALELQLCNGPAQARQRGGCHHQRKPKLIKLRLPRHQQRQARTNHAHHARQSPARPAHPARPLTLTPS